jgi:hypothetical protein
MNHAIDEDIKNSHIEYCIDEYVRNIEHRRILKEKWFEGKTLGELSADHNISESSVKDIIYGIGDKILLKAAEIQPNNV